MKNQVFPHSPPRAATAAAGAPAQLASAGLAVARYGLAIVVGWIGAMKFTAVEASAIEPLVRNSPLLGWMYGIMSVRRFSNTLGVVELLIAAAIAARRWSPRIAAAGSAAAVAMFLTTLTFLFSTPGWEQSLGGFPALAVLPGQFLLKDLVLLGTALWSFAEAADAVSPRARHR
jgi:uncharacterized membrane protein YkgB